MENSPRYYVQIPRQVTLTDLSPDDAHRYTLRMLVPKRTATVFNSGRSCAQRSLHHGKYHDRVIFKAKVKLQANPSIIGFAHASPKLVLHPAGKLAGFTNF